MEILRTCVLNPSWLSFFPSILPSPFLPFIFPHLLAFLPPSPKTADRRPNDRPHIFLFFLNLFSSFFSFHRRPTNQQKQYEEEERTKLAAHRPTHRPTDQLDNQIFFYFNFFFTFMEYFFFDHPISLRDLLSVHPSAYYFQTTKILRIKWR